jgi:Fe-S oxidoreductase
MHVNSGYPEDAYDLVANHASTFGGYDAIVVPRRSCAGSIRHQHAEIAARHGNSELVEETRQVAARTYELSEFLVDVLGVVDVGAHYPHRVMYHPICHSLRVLRVGDRPYRLLRAVRDLELVELADAESCCGFGGTFAVKNVDVSGAILSDKIDAIEANQTSRVTVPAGSYVRLPAWSAAIEQVPRVSRWAAPLATVQTLGVVLVNVGARPEDEVALSGVFACPSGASAGCGSR